jgi:NMD protein affecting ribosome stability and mRNA decay
MGMQEDKMVCDQCGTVITRVENLPAEGWPHLHSLCSNCFAELGKKSG